MSKPPPPNGQIAPGDFIAQRTDRDNASAYVEAEEARQEHIVARANHDAAMARAVAAELAAEWQREQARPVPPPRRPGEGEVPAERFGPADRRVGSERK